MSGDKAKIAYLKEHLSYELSMLIFTYMHLNKIDTKQLIWNAMFESFFVHFRNIAIFLKSDDDNRNWTACDFDAEFFLDLKERKEIEGLLPRIQSQIMHLGKKRGDNSKRVSIKDIIKAYEWSIKNLDSFISRLNEFHQEAYISGLFQDENHTVTIDISVRGPITTSSNPSMMKPSITGPKTD